MGGVSPQTPLRELTALSRFPSWNLGALLLRGERKKKGEKKGKEKEEKGRGKGEGKAGELFL